MNPAREDILIGRVTDGEASSADWSELEALAARDPAVWTRLANSQREHAALGRAVDDALTVCELVAAPDLHPDRSANISLRWRAWSGWAAAAALGLAWLTASRLGVAPTLGPGSQVNTGGVGGVWVPTNLAPDQYFTNYLDSGRDSGRVLAELPLTLVERRPAMSGQGAEIIYIRRLLERAVVSDVYTIGVDEHGDLVPAPMSNTLIPVRDPL